MAEKIEITRKGYDAQVLVDGVEIDPSAIVRDSVIHNLKQDSRPTISLRLMAERILIDDDGAMEEEE